MSARAADGRWSNLGGSLPVPNVQALVDSGRLTDQVPGRYIRPDLRAGHDVKDTVLATEDGSHEGDVNIPVVDMARLLDPGTSEEEAAKLRMACEDWGFFQLINHGVPGEVIASIKENLQAFYKQPLEERMKSAQPPGKVEGYGQAFVVSDDQKLDWADMLFLYAQPCSIRNYDLWPKQPPTFREALAAYSKEVKKVASYLFHQMAKNLGLDNPERLTGMMKDGVQGIRMNYYPPCLLSHDKVLGISPHSDPVVLTVLLQIGVIPGLQIRRHGNWLPVQPQPEAFIVNIGDIIEILSNGKYKSIEHRAMVDMNKERISIAAFHNPNFDALVGPLSEFCNETQPLFKSLSFPEYTRQLFASKLEGKRILDNMKL